MDLSASETPKHPYREDIIRLLTAVVALAAALFSVTKQYPTAAKLVAAFGLLVLVSLLVPLLRRAVVWLKNRNWDHRFVESGERQLATKFRSFGQFTSPNDMRSLMSILRSGASNDANGLTRILASDYISDWLSTFQYQLEFPARTPAQFLHRCREFTLIVSDFNRFYVQPTNKEVLAQTDVPPPYIDQLEAFRDDFNDYLRGLEKWAQETSTTVIGHAGFFNAPFTCHFERAKTFRRAISAGERTNP